MKDERLIISARNLLKSSLVIGDIKPDQVQQVGIDLTVKSIKKINGGTLRRNKTQLHGYSYIEPDLILEKDGNYLAWVLEPGVYSLTCNEDIVVPNDYCVLIKHRSSLIRMGSYIDGGLYDPGFYSKDGVGCCLVVSERITIETNSRVGQVVFLPCEFILNEDLYDGQWNNSRDVK